eukprot:g12672.t1
MSPRGVGGHGAGGTCRVCQALLEEDRNTDTKSVEKSTRVILGLMSHYSETLLSVIKRGPSAKDQELKRHAEDSDNEEDVGQGSMSPMCLGIIIVSFIIVIGAIIAIIVVVAKKKQNKSSSSFVQVESMSASDHAPGGVASRAELLEGWRANHHRTEESFLELLAQSMLAA